MNLGALFTSIGDAGSQAADAKMKADQFKLDQLMTQLGIKQGQAQLEETQARTKKLGQPVPTEADKIQQTVDAVEKSLGRKLTDEEKQRYLGVAAPPPPKAPNITNEFEAWREAFKARMGRYPTDLELDAHKKSEQKAAAPAKPSKTVTYDPSGHLRTAWVDPTTGEVSAWGPLAEAKSGIYHYKDDETGNIIEVPTYKPGVKPGTIRMTEEARKAWEEQIEGKDTHATRPLSKPTTPMGTPTGQSGAGKVIGHTSPRDVVGLKDAVKSAQAGYTVWQKANENANLKSPKGDLAIIYDAVRSSVEGAGRMTNAEIDRQIKSGSLGDKWQRSISMAYDGTLPDKQRQENLDVIRNAWDAKAKTARESWKSLYKDREMPAFIKGDPTSEKQTGGSGAPPPGAKITSLDDFLKEKP